MPVLRILTLCALLGGMSLSAAQLVISPAYWEIGDISEGEQHAQTFKLQNTSNTSILISDIVSSCGCTLTDIKAPFTLPAGTTREFTVTFDAEGLQGEISRGIRLEAADASLNLAISARVFTQGGLLSQPRALLFTDSAEDPQTLAIQTRTNSPQILKMQTTEGFRVEQDANTGMLKVSMLEFKGIRGELKVETQDHGQITVPLVSSGPKVPFSVNPTAILLRGAVGDNLEQTVTISDWDYPEDPVLAIEGQPITLKKDPEGNFLFTLEAVPRKIGTTRYALQIIHPLSRTLLKDIPLILQGTH